MCAELTIRLDETLLRAAGGNRKATDVAVLRRKILRETERYVNDPRAASWARLDAPRPPAA